MARRDAEGAEGAGGEVAGGALEVEDAGRGGAEAGKQVAASAWVSGVVANEGEVDGFVVDRGDGGVAVVKARGEAARAEVAAVEEVAVDRAAREEVEVVGAADHEEVDALERGHRLEELDEGGAGELALGDVGCDGDDDLIAQGAAAGEQRGEAAA